jgi:hypothetical protein
LLQVVNTTFAVSQFKSGQNLPKRHFFAQKISDPSHSISLVYHFDFKEWYVGRCYLKSFQAVMGVFKISCLLRRF